MSLLMGRGGDTPWIHHVMEAGVYAGYCALLFHLLGRRHLLRTTFVYLALPYFIFAAAWLRPLAATLLAGALLTSLALAFRAPTPIEMRADETRAYEGTVGSFLCFVVVLLWVHLSGAGGFGFQTVDYELHNGRLLDLVQCDWPVKYGTDQNLVFYLAYQLPAALAGKVLGYAGAQKVLYLWTILGVWQAALWLSRLTERSLTVWLALAFALFGPLDILGYWYTSLRATTDASQALLPAFIEELCFWQEPAFPFFLGNYLSSTFQFYWAPHQSIAGWLVMAVVTWLFWERRPQSMVFAYSLLCFWSPLIAIGLLPYFAILFLASLRQQRRDLFSLQNLLAPTVLVSVFGLFYLGGSAARNPITWVPSRLPLEKLDHLVVFYAVGWVLYLLVIAPAVRGFSAPRKVSLLALCLTLLLAPLVVYGAYSDLLCRSSGPMMFLLLVFLIHSLHRYRPVARALVISLLLLSTGSALHQIQTSIQFFGETRHAVSVPRTAFAYENLGRDSSFSARHLMKAQSQLAGTLSGPAPYRRRPRAASP